MGARPDKPISPALSDRACTLLHESGNTAALRDVEGVDQQAVTVDCSRGSSSSPAGSGARRDSAMPRTIFAPWSRTSGCETFLLD